MHGRDEYEGVVRSTFAQLDLWRATPPIFTPGSGSQLRGDDDDWPGFSISQLAHSGVVVAVEHLQALRVHVDRRSPELVELFPLAHATLCRTALVGAAQAVWLLAPDERAERLRRHHTVIAEMQARHLEYLDGLQKLAGADRHEGTDVVAEHVAMLSNQMAVKRAELGESSDRFNTTRMIREAACAAYRGRHDSERLVEETVLVWRAGSGAAHGFLWPLFGGAGTEQISSADARGNAAFVARGSFEAIAQPYMAAYILCEAGWKLLRRRGR
ncbi:hypothetical protein [Nocardia farcinica]|uniref:hypothetical protein n=1 Tax=Nocardia farcinica TaxID=37329 RepID=UPI00245721B7|nr:hypothetical protein [Nocardia farcinica]